MKEPNKLARLVVDVVKSMGHTEPKKTDFYIWMAGCLYETGWSDFDYNSIGLITREEWQKAKMNAYPNHTFDRTQSLK